MIEGERNLSIPGCLANTLVISASIAAIHSVTSAGMAASRFRRWASCAAITCGFAPLLRSAAIAFSIVEVVVAQFQQCVAVHLGQALGECP